MNRNLNVAINRINEAIEQKSTKLSLLGLDLESIPTEIFKIKNLKEVDLGFNKFREIPKEIFDIKSLIKLDMKENLIIEIPRDILLLNNLVSLYLDDNKIEEIPSFLLDAKKLELLIIANNPIQNIPYEIYNRKQNVYDEIRNYLHEVSKHGVAKIYEGKLIIVGNGGVGKTTLANKLINRNFKVPGPIDTTRGMDVVYYNFTQNYKGEEINFKANVWDFGGQEIYHTTHQFFLTQRSLYVLVLDNRQENDNLDYWLTITSILGGNSKIIIVINEKENRKRDISKPIIKKHFPNVDSIIEVDFANNRGLNMLTDRINFLLFQLKHVGKNLPLRWVEIKKELEKDDRDLIKFNTFEELCNKYEIRKIEEILLLSQFLHDLGVILHFKDDLVLYDAIILNPQWGTKAVYSILESQLVADQQKGAFSADQLSSLLGKNNYPKTTHGIVINLMMRFELCYEIEISNNSFWSNFLGKRKAKSYVAPQLLNIDPPDDKVFIDNGSSSLRFKYEVMPPGIITRLIVRLHSYIKDGIVWKEGVVLQWNGSKAIVTLDKIKKEINIVTGGKYDRAFLSIIRNNINVIHNSFHSLKYEAQVPCNCVDCKDSIVRHYFSIDILKKALAKNTQNLVCYNSFDKISVKGLLDDLEDLRRRDRVAKETLIYTLFSSIDRNYKDKLEISLLSLKNYGIKLNDPSKILPGAIIEREIESDIDRADIMIMLISPDFISHELISDPIKIALEKVKRQKLYLVPVIVRPCNWDDTNLNRHQVLPRNGQAISLSDNKDEVYLNIVKEIKELIVNEKYN